jgi:hypothetical protein
LNETRWGQGERCRERERERERRLSLLSYFSAKKLGIPIKLMFEYLDADTMNA